VLIKKNNGIAERKVRETHGLYRHRATKEMWTQFMTYAGLQPKYFTCLQFISCS